MNILPFKIALTSPIHYDTFVSEEVCIKCTLARAHMYIYVRMYVCVCVLSVYVYSFGVFSILILRTKILRDDTLFSPPQRTNYFHRFYPTLSGR